MKTKTPKVTITQIINDIEASGKDGFLFVGTSYKKVAHLSLIVVANGTLKTFSTPIRKQGSGKRDVTASKVKRFYASKNWWILTPEKIEETNLDKHEFDSLPSDKLVKEKFIEVFRAKLKYSYPEFCLFRNLFKYTVNKISEKEIDVPEEVPAVEAPENYLLEKLNKFYNENVEPEEVPAVEEPKVVAKSTKEDLLIDQIVKLDADRRTKFCVPFIERLLDAGDSNLPLIDKIRQLDITYFHAQEVCNALSNSDKEIRNIQTASDLLSKFIVGLTSIVYELNNKLEDAKATAYIQQKSIEKNTEAATKLYSEIDAEISKIEEENSEKAKAEAKVTDIMANLSDTERELLMKALGLKPEAKIVENPVTVSDNITVSDNADNFVIVMNNGDTRTIGKDWSEIIFHLRQVALKKETVNVSICEYVANLLKSGMSRKELGEKLNSEHYADTIIKYCVELGLYKINVKGRTYTGNTTEAMRKAAEARKKKSAIKKKVIAEDLKKKASKLASTN